MSIQLQSSKDDCWMIQSSLFYNTNIYNHCSRKLVCNMLLLDDSIGLLLLVLSVKLIRIPRHALILVPGFRMVLLNGEWDRNHQTRVNPLELQELFSDRYIWQCIHP